MVVEPPGGSAWRSILTCPCENHQPPSSCICALLARHARQVGPTTRVTDASVCTLLQQVLLLLERAESRPAVLQWSRASYGLLNTGANARARVHRQPPPLLPWSASGLYMASNAVRPLKPEVLVGSTRADALLDHSWRRFD